MRGKPEPDLVLMRGAERGGGLLLLAALGLGLAWSLALVLPHLRGQASLLDRIEAPLADLRFLVAGPRPAPADVVVVAIDDATIAAAGAYPLPRAYVARLLRALSSAGARAIGVDVLFVAAGTERDDADLAAAFSETRAVIAMAALFPRLGDEARARTGALANLPVAERLLRPADRFSQAAGLGLVNVATDHGGIARHVPLLVVAEGELQPSLPLRLAALAAGRDPDFGPDAVTLGGLTVPLDVGASLALRFYGPQGTVRTVSAADVVEGRAGGAGLQGRLVLVGATSPGSGDVLPTPFDRVLPGVEILATALAHLTAGDALVRTATVRRIDAGIALLLPALAILLVAFRRVALGLGLACLLVALTAGAVTGLFAYGIWLSLALPLAAVAVPVLAYLGARLWLDRRQAVRLTRDRDALLRFHPPAVAARLAREPDFLVLPVEQAAAVLFVDLSGFTGLSERLGPASTRALLKDMHDIVEDAATLRDGSVTSFMGDGAMILFGLPEARPDDPDRALATARDLAARLAAWLDREIGPGQGGVRIGVHSGPVVVSRLGGTRNQHITATGDTVNVTSRLLDIAKAEGAPIVLTGDLIAALHRPSSLPEPPVLTARAVRGRARPITVHCLGAPV
ncbi:adenylate/guanylate cyclase domain-containing protein [Methylobacterium sp. Leaf108]|uniref:CHASE2 domain-containing protein n=1 Tax=Methylobacterium sp. Leaf108 TaxID=1736256 RepID=UPI0012E83F1B|nr:adenylate/guanylate cyclase domain-containing protein [Methylobacterium sp. Leaf108]